MDTIDNQTRTELEAAVYRRLVELKSLYDPENTFRVNQNVAPRPNPRDIQ